MKVKFILIIIFSINYACKKDIPQDNNTFKTLDDALCIDNNIYLIERLDQKYNGKTYPIEYYFYNSKNLIENISYLGDAPLNPKVRINFEYDNSNRLIKYNFFYLGSIYYFFKIEYEDLTSKKIKKILKNDKDFYFVTYQDNKIIKNSIEGDIVIFDIDEKGRIASINKNNVINKIEYSNTGSNYLQLSNFDFAINIITDSFSYGCSLPIKSNNLSNEVLLLNSPSNIPIMISRTINNSKTDTLLIALKKI